MGELLTVLIERLRTWDDVRLLLSAMVFGSLWACYVIYRDLRHERGRTDRMHQEMHAARIKEIARLTDRIEASTRLTKRLSVALQWLKDEPD